MYAYYKTNYLIVDTCTLLKCGELIARMLVSIWTKQLSFKFVIPIVVRQEIEYQAVSVPQCARINTLFAIIFFSLLESQRQKPADLHLRFVGTSPRLYCREDHAQGPSNECTKVF